MSQFLLVYRRSTGELMEFVEYPDDRKRALEARWARERLEKDDPDVEVVLLGAASREALLKTHSRYFKTVRELVEALSDALLK